MGQKLQNIKRLLLTAGTLFFVPMTVVIIARIIIPYSDQIRSISVPRAVTTPKPINVLEIRYFPNNAVAQNIIVDGLSSELDTAMGLASAPKLYKDAGASAFSDVVIKRSLERDRSSPLTTGSDATYYHSMDTMLTADGENLCDYIVANDIDQVWFWKDVGDDTGGFDQEYYRVWSTTHFPVQSPTPLCGGQRSFLVLGLDQNRTVSEAIHSYGHSVESLISQSEGTELFWNRYAGASHEYCGNVHFPPNAIGDYDYDIATVSAVTSCEDWHPDGSGATTTVDCNRWGCTGVGYLKWWFQNMPNDANGLTYSGKSLPNWWDFASDTDAAFTNAANLNQWLSPYFADLARPSYIDSISGAGQASGTTLSVSHTVSGSNRLFMVGSSYRSPSHSTTVSGNEQITAVTIGATPLTRVNRTIFHEYVTELWYVTAPPLGTSTVTVTFASGVQDEAISGVSFIGIDQSSPFDTDTGYQEGTVSGTNPTISIPSTTSQVLFGVVSMYTGSNNDLGYSGNTQGIWGFRTTNVISKGGVATGGPSSTLSWTSLVTWPWSISAVAINQIQATPTPTPTSTPEATSGPTCNSNCSSNAQCPSDLICDSGRCRRPGCTALDTCTCGPSCNSTCHSNSECPSDLICDGGKCRKAGCTALDSCNCGTASDESVTPTSAPATLRASMLPKTTSKLPSVNIKANGADFLNVFPAKSVTLSWTSSNVTLCKGSDGWSGMKTTTGIFKTNILSKKSNFFIMCKGPLGIVTDQVTVTAVNPALKTFIGGMTLNGVDASHSLNPYAPVVTVAKGSRPLIAWNTNAISCVAGGGWSGTKSARGSHTVAAVFSDTTFTLSCRLTPNSAPQNLSVTARVL